jgi:thymidylate kinase
MKVTTQNIRHMIWEHVNKIDPKAEMILYASRARDDE